jgi:hypothetical protein
VVVLLAVLAGAALSAALGPLVLDRLPTGLPWLLGLVVAAGTIDAVLARGLTAAPSVPRPALPLPAVAGLDARRRDGARGGPRAGARRSPRGCGGPGGVDGSGSSGARGPPPSGSASVPPWSGPRPSPLGGAAVVLAGLLAAPVAFVSTGQAAGFTVRGIAAAALLGRGGPAWAVPAGLLLGLTEVAGASWWPGAGGELAVAVVVVGVLVVRGGPHRRAWGRTW